MLEQELEKIGLSEKEAKVYVAAMQLGQAPVQQIAHKARVNRATTYVILESLAQKGVISTMDEGKKREFVAVAPHALHNVISQQQEELKRKAAHLKEIMPQLNTVFNVHPSKPVVRFYEGKEGLKTILEERLHDAPKEVALFYPPEEVKKIFTEQESEQYRQRRAKLGTMYRSIRSTNDLGESAPSEMSDAQKVSYETYPFYCDIAVYDDKVSISILKGHVSGVVIESRAVADTFRSIFSLIRDLKKK